VRGQCHAPGRLPPGKTRYPLYRRLGGPQGRSGHVRKISPPPGIDPRAVQPVASHYTNWATGPTVTIKDLWENGQILYLVCKLCDVLLLDKPKPHTVPSVQQHTCKRALFLLTEQCHWPRNASQVIGISCGITGSKTRTKSIVRYILPLKTRQFILFYFIYHVKNIFLTHCAWSCLKMIVQTETCSTQFITQ
jgi:hypothetical protein